jgi:hypothetical protein
MSKGGGLVARRPIDTPWWLGQTTRRTMNGLTRGCTPFLPSQIRPTGSFAPLSEAPNDTQRPHASRMSRPSAWP